MVISGTGDRLGQEVSGSREVTNFFHFRETVSLRVISGLIRTDFNAQWEGIDAVGVWVSKV
jgi:hypothetical protein